MICQDCLDAALGGLRVAHCQVCDRIVAVYNDGLPEAEQSVYRHSLPGGKGVWTCPGSKRPPVYKGGGHPACACPCQHKPPGSWNGRPTA